MPWASRSEWLGSLLNSFNGSDAARRAARHCLAWCRSISIMLGLPGAPVLGRVDVVPLIGLHNNSATVAVVYDMVDFSVVVDGAAREHQVHEVHSGPIAPTTSTLYRSDPFANVSVPASLEVQISYVVTYRPMNRPRPIVRASRSIKFRAMLDETGAQFMSKFNDLQTPTEEVIRYPRRWLLASPQPTPPTPKAPPQ